MCMSIQNQAADEAETVTLTISADETEVLAVVTATETEVLAGETMTVALAEERMLRPSEADLLLTDAQRQKTNSKNQVLVRGGDFPSFCFIICMRHEFGRKSIAHGNRCRFHDSKDSHSRLRKK